MRRSAFAAIVAGFFDATGSADKLSARLLKLILQPSALARHQRAVAARRKRRRNIDCRALRTA